VRPLPQGHVASDAEALGAPGRFLIFVWALEQRGQERRRFDEQGREEASTASKAADSAPAEDDMQWRKDQDLLVPWVMQQPSQPPAATDEGKGRNPPDRTDDAPVYQRCESAAFLVLHLTLTLRSDYHVFREG
jgi:hypothetical protein